MSEVTLPLPKLDGHTARKLTITFTGVVELDRRLDDNLELLNELRLGQDVQLVVTARPVGKGFTATAKRVTTAKRSMPTTP